MSAVLEKVLGGLGEKKRWTQYRARVRALPAGPRTAAEALEHYLMHRTAPSDAGALMDMYEELVGVLETVSAGGAALEDVLGHDPVRCAESLRDRHLSGDWFDAERERLVSAIARARAEEGITR